MFAVRSSHLCVAFYVLSLFSKIARARFSEAVCLDNHCLQSIGNGSNICLVPDPTRRGGLKDARCTSSKLASLVSIHASRVQRGEAPPIAYVDVLTKRVLGGANWSVHEWQAGLDAGVIAACLTGQRSDGSSETVCYMATADDDFAVRTEQCNGRTECGAIHPTTISMLLDQCWKYDSPPSPLDHILGQSHRLNIAAEQHNLHAVPWTPSDDDEEMTTLRAIPLTAYELDQKVLQTEILGTAYELSEREKPRHMRH